MTAFFYQITGAFLGVLGGFFAAGVNRIYDAEREFLIFMQVKRGEIPHDKSEMEWEAVKFYRRTKPKIREAISRVMPFLSKKQVSALEALWTTYDTELTKQELQGDAMVEVFYKFQADKNYPLTDKGVLKMHIQSFCDVVKSEGVFRKILRMRF